MGPINRTHTNNNTSNLSEESVTTQGQRSGGALLFLRKAQQAEERSGGSLSFLRKAQGRSAAPLFGRNKPAPSLFNVLNALNEATKTVKVKKD